MAASTTNLVAVPQGENALFRFSPSLRGLLPWQNLGRWPTPVQELRIPGCEPVFIKREDLSSALYGGNKVRTLEGHLGAALAQGAESIWSTGAYGSNHATATCLHANSLGLGSGVALFPQPPTLPAHENMRAFLSMRPETMDIPNVALLPAALARLSRHRSRYIMRPGGATPIGSLGHVGAGLELAEQIQANLCPAPRAIVIAVGSTCSTAGLLVGLHLAAKLGIAFGPGSAPIPELVAVRATPWPVTSKRMILWLARKTAAHLVRFGGPRLAVNTGALAGTLKVEGRYLGRGYGRPAASTRGAKAIMARAGGPPLDEVYSGKSGAALIQRAFSGSHGPFLFWATKSSAPLPENSHGVEAAPKRWQRWLEKTPLR